MTKRLTQEEWERMNTSNDIPLDTPAYILRQVIRYQSSKLDALTEQLEKAIELLKRGSDTAKDTASFLARVGGQ
jgi:hypothetical protein